jgi:hypothetical protein
VLGWGGNQSLRRILTRLAGSINGAAAAWAIAALLVAVRTRPGAAARRA